MSMKEKFPTTIMPAELPTPTTKPPEVVPTTFFITCTCPECGELASLYEPVHPGGQNVFSCHCGASWVQWYAVERSLPIWNQSEDQYKEKYPNTDQLRSDADKISLPDQAVANVFVEVMKGDNPLVAITDEEISEVMETGELKNKVDSKVDPTDELDPLLNPPPVEPKPEPAPAPEPMPSPAEEQKVAVPTETQVEAQTEAKKE